MFTGIIEEIGKVASLRGPELVIQSSLVVQDLAEGDSIAVNGAGSGFDSWRCPFQSQVVESHAAAVVRAVDGIDIDGRALVRRNLSCIPAEEPTVGGGGVGSQEFPSRSIGQQDKKLHVVNFAAAVAGVHADELLGGVHPTPAGQRANGYRGQGRVLVQEQVI